MTTKGETAGPDDPFTASTGATGQGRRGSGDDLRDALDSLGDSYAGDPRDWGAYYRDAWTYGLILGWECEDDHAHDDDCGGAKALMEVAERYGWSEETTARHRRLRAAIHSYLAGDRP